MDLHTKGVVNSNRGRLIIWLIILLLLSWDIIALFGDQIPSSSPQVDFLGYWAAGQLFWEGKNPYNAEALLAVERSIGWTESEAMIAWAPPWIHVILFPLERASFQASRIIWFLVNLLALILVALTMGKEESVANAKPLTPLLAVLLYIPCLLSLLLGSVSPLVIAGLLAFLKCIKKRLDVAAGCLLILSSLKPHIIYLFWPFLILWVIKSGRWRVIISYFGSMLLLLGLTHAQNPRLFRYYIQELFSQDGSWKWATPTPFTLLRMIIPVEAWALSIPLLVLGMLCMLFVWRKWLQGYPLSKATYSLALISTLTVPYLWTGDLVVLLPNIIVIILRFHQKLPHHNSLLIALIIIQILILYQILGENSYLLLFLVTPTVAVCWIFSEKVAEKGSNRRQVAPVPRVP